MRHAGTASTEPTLASFLERIQTLEATIERWDDSERLTVQALKEAVEALHKEAFTRIIRGLKDNPAASAALREVVSDEVVYAVLRHLALVRPSLNERIEQALASIRPLLQSHGGNVELVRVDPPDAVEIRLIGSCDGCPASSLTLTGGIEKALSDHCPEITTIKKSNTVSSLASEHEGSASLCFVSPFTGTTHAEWQIAASLVEIPEAGLKAVEVAGRSLLLSRRGQAITCFENACAHMGLPLDRGAIAEGVLTCPHHGFQYDLSSGNCLTAPGVQLIAQLVRVVGANVKVKLRPS